MFKETLALIWFPLVLAILVTPLRFTLEYIGLPEGAIFFIGLLWFTLALSIYLAVKLKNHQSKFLVLFLSLLILSPISRIPVALAWLFDKTYDLGTHYGDYFDSFTQALLNHVFYGSLIQIVPSYALGCIVLMFTSRKHQ